MARDDGSMHTNGKMLIALAALVVSHPAAAEPVYYDCDTPGGKYSEIMLTQAEAAHRVRGTITPMELRAAADWFPTATVYVQSKDKRDLVSVQLMNRSGKTLAVSVSLVQSGKVRKAELGAIKINQAVAFDIYLPASGEGFVQLAGKKIPVGITLGAGAKVSVTCSSGHFRFDPLDWAWQQLP